MCHLVANHNKVIDTKEVASWIREYTGGYPFLVSRLCQQMDEMGDWSHAGLLNAVKVILNERNTLFDDMIKKIEQFPDLKSLLMGILFSGETRKYNAHNTTFQLAEQFNIINIYADGTYSISSRIMETVIYEYFMSQEKESEIYSAGAIEKTQFIKGVGHHLCGSRDSRRNSHRPHHQLPQSRVCNRTEDMARRQLQHQG